ncbi:putative acyltransferase [Phascolomyces articulosus]|uniref:Acyltransferase n=1 Tax=Phascolomyces articulosus TaxID=60185 RepID=A0AAD5K291_9FUNG|nr:putative acyltransferase [Phascolomyces articulosus]
MKTDEQKYQNIMDHVGSLRLRENPSGFFQNIGKHYSGTDWRGYETFIGTKLFYSGHAEEMKNNILNSQSVRNIIEEMAEQKTIQYETEQDSNKKKKLNREKFKQTCIQKLNTMASKIVTHSVTTMESKRKLRWMALMTEIILARLYDQGIYINKNQWVELRRIALIAEKNKQPLLLLPSHKSHIDYMVINYLMVRLGFQIPHTIAVENNNQSALFGSLLKSVGALYIRQEWGDDVLYKTIMEEYFSLILSNGLNLQCFIEGTQSRLGKLLTPKLGVLKMILESFGKGRFSDCYVVPIAISYEKTLELESYTDELLGNPQKQESLSGLLGVAPVLLQKMGRVDARIGKPYSLKQWVEREMKSRGHVDLVNDNENKTMMVKSFAYQILSDINAITPILPTSLVGTVILTLRGRGTGRNELVRRIDWLTEMIRAKNREVVKFPNMTTDDLIDRVLSMHKHLFGQRQEQGIIEPTYYGTDRFELSYYRNQVIHLFIEEAIICASLYTIIKKGGGQLDQRMRFYELLKEVTFLSSLLKMDMIYKPGTIEDNTRRTVQWLVDHNVLYFDQENDWIGLSEVERKSGRENYDFLCFLIWPFIESYWLTCVSLFALTPSPLLPQNQSIFIDSRVFMARTQALGKTLYFQGELSYLEAVNKETITNAFHRFEQEGVLLRNQYSQLKDSWSEVGLNIDYIPERYNGVLVPRGRLWELAELIGKFRREGKNRRDNVAVSSHVLQMANDLAERNDSSTLRNSKL